jgi:hypothetical protein
MIGINTALEVSEPSGFFIVEKFCQPSKSIGRQLFKNLWQISAEIVFSLINYAVKAIQLKKLIKKEVG